MKGNDGSVSWRRSVAALLALVLAQSGEPRALGEAGARCCLGDRLRLLGGAVRDGHLAGADPAGVWVAEDGLGTFHAPWERIVHLECRGPLPDLDRDGCLAYLRSHLGAIRCTGPATLRAVLGRLLLVDSAGEESLSHLESVLGADPETAPYTWHVWQALNRTPPTADVPAALRLTGLWRRGLRGCLHGTRRWRRLAAEVAAWEARACVAAGRLDQEREIRVWSEAVLGVQLDGPIDSHRP